MIKRLQVLERWQVRLLRLGTRSSLEVAVPTSCTMSIDRQREQECGTREQIILLKIESINDGQ